MIAAKTWKEMRALALIYLGLLVLQHAIAIYEWPDLRSPALLRLVPADFMRRWIAGLDTYVGYMALEVFFKGGNVVGLAAAVLLGTGLVARERENHSLEFLLARPVSRSRVLFGKFAVAALVVSVPLVLAAWSTIPLGVWMVDESLPFGEVTIAAVYNAVFCLLFLALTTLCSVLFRTQVHAAFAIGVVVVFQLSIYFVQGIRAISVFLMSDYDVYGPILAGNTPIAELLFDRAIWLLLAIVVVYGITDRVFARQEI